MRNVTRLTAARPRRGNGRTAASTIALMVVGALLLAACGTADEAASDEAPGATEAPAPDPEPAEEAEASGGTLIWGQAENIIDWDPLHAPVGNWIHMYQVFDTLTLQDENLVPQPRLAESWSLADDGLSITFNLRQGVTFHDGSSFDADDVVYTFNRLADPESGATIHGLSRWIVSVEAVDSHTVLMTFDEPTPMVFDLVDITPIMSSDTSDEDLRTNPNGTGPFVLDEAATGDFARLVANPDWWGDGPYVDEILVRILPDPQGASIALETGEVHTYDAIPFQERARFAEDSSYMVMATGLGGLNSHIYFNVEREPFDNALVRRAFHYAMDRSALVDTYFHGQSEVWCLPWPDNSLAFDAELARGCEQDYERAAELMAEAGFPDGFEAEILSRPDSGDTVAEILQQDMLECCNVRLTINSMSHAEAQPIWGERNFTIFAHQYARAGRDPSLLLDGTVVFPPGGASRSNYDNPQYTDIVSRVRSTLDPPERQAVLRELNEFLLQEAFTITLAPVPRAFVIRDGVTGVRANPEGWPILDRVRVID